jgi:hypothetical protein
MSQSKTEELTIVRTGTAGTATGTTTETKAVTTSTSKGPAPTLRADVIGAAGVVGVVAMLAL